MSKVSPNTRLYNHSSYLNSSQIHQEQVHPNVTKKSISRRDNFDRTPHIQQVNPYLDRIEQKSTDKKRVNLTQPIQPSILLEQNRQLLA